MQPWSSFDSDVPFPLSSQPICLYLHCSATFRLQFYQVQNYWPCALFLSSIKFSLTGLCCREGNEKALAMEQKAEKIILEVARYFSAT